MVYSRSGKSGNFSFVCVWNYWIALQFYIFRILSDERCTTIHHSNLTIISRNTNLLLNSNLEFLKFIMLINFCIFWTTQHNEMEVKRKRGFVWKRYIHTDHWNKKEVISKINQVTRIVLKFSFLLSRILYIKKFNFGEQFSNISFQFKI